MPADSSNLVVSPHFLESGSIYVYKRDFDAYFCSVGRVYVKKDTRRVGRYMIVWKDKKRRRK